MSAPAAPVTGSRTLASADRPAPRRLLRYALWQARDYAIGPGVATLLIGALFAWQARMIAQGVAAGPFGDTVARGIYATLLGPLAFLVTLLGTNGLVSNDRTRGYYRLLFSKPISVRRYYLQAFGVHWLGCFVSAGLILALIGLAVGRPAPAALLGFFALHYLALGGIVFLASTLSRFDWVIAAVIWNVPELVHALATAARQPLARLIDPLLPPTYALGDIIAALVGGQRPPVGPSVWLVAYGALCLGAGLVLVRRRAFAR